MCLFPIWKISTFFLFFAWPSHDFDVPLQRLRQTQHNQRNNNEKNHFWNCSIAHFFIGNSSTRKQESLLQNPFFMRQKCERLLYPVLRQQPSTHQGGRSMGCIRGLAEWFYQSPPSPQCQSRGFLSSVSEES